MPFLLRGVNLLGIDSGTSPIAVRQATWDRLATDLRPRHLDAIARRITMAELPDAIDDDARGARVRTARRRRARVSAADVTERVHIYQGR